MKYVKIISLALLLFSLGIISALSVQDLIDDGKSPQIKFGSLDLIKKNLTSLDGLQNLIDISEIKNLYLDNNNLTTLQSDLLKKLINLEVLLLNYNYLTTQEINKIKNVLPKNVYIQTEEQRNPADLLGAGQSKTTTTTTTVPTPQHLQPGGTTAPGPPAVKPSSLIEK